MNLIDQCKSITTFVFDVDGVLTDGTVYAMDDGQQVRRMSVKDGYALQLAVKKGYHVLIISGGHSPAVVSRLNKLGISNVFMDVTDKVEVLATYMRDHALKKTEILYMGDDIPDYLPMLEAGLSCAPADAAEDIRRVAGYIAHSNGGHGCAREVIEKVLKLRDDWHIETHIPSR